MKVLARTSCTLAMCTAIAVLAGCGGGSGSPIGSAALPAEPGIAPLGSTVTYTAVHNGHPFKGAQVWLKKYNEQTLKVGAYIRNGKTNAMGKVAWSGFNLDQAICLGWKAKITTKNGWQLREDQTCWRPGYLPLKKTFHV